MNRLVSLAIFILGVALLLAARFLMPIEITPRAVPDYMRGVAVVLFFAAGLVSVVLGAARLVSK